MNDLQMREVSKAVLSSMTEAELANRQREQEGVHVVCHRGRYWRETSPGFYEPSHRMARLSAEQATPPVPLLCWGFRAALCEDDAAVANGSIPIHLLSNVEGYDLQGLSSNRRYHLRKCRKLVELVELANPALLQEQGYEVVLSALKRTAHKKAPSREDYLADIADYTSPGRRLILAGLIGTKLGGYITAHAVNGTAFIDKVYLATEALLTHIGTGLVFEFVQVCRRSGEIREIVYGLHTPEDSALSVFKEGMGFPVKHVPTKVQMNPIIGKFICWRYPHVYYRLTGHNTSVKVEPD